ncbi:MAG: hypothetical protein LBT43_14610 [Prevotella sp.]|jgi:hypothetical protein|uniref:hypothetical protein n=1 Tax=Dysgonomonas gadei TaxID=156974 RepID=UPI00282B7AAF|nr:hypothetical protein [Prevotella sp.]
MADFDNGLPPEGIDITNNNVTGVNISISDTDEQSINKISAVLISTEPAGKNTAMFL